MTSPDELLTQLSTAIHMLTTSPSSTELVFDDLLIRYEEMLRTANCGFTEPRLLSDDPADAAKEIEVTEVSSAFCCYFCYYCKQRNFSDITIIIMIEATQKTVIKYCP